MSENTIELVPVKLRLNNPTAFRKTVMGLHSHASDPAQLHRRIAEGACELLNAGDAALILFDFATGRLTAAHVCANELPAELSPDLDLRDSVIGRVVASGAPVAHTDITPGGDYYPVFQRAASELTVAVLFGRRALGALVVASPRPNAFTQQHVETLGMFADQAAIALEHSGRFANARAEAGSWEELFRHFKDGMLVCDAGLKIQRVNGGFLKMSNRSVAQLQNCAAQDVFYRLSIFGSQEDFWELLERHGRHELKFRTPSGRRSFHLTGARITLRGEPGYLLVLRETTHQDELQDRINSADKLASVTSVVARIAHKLNDRLQSVLGLAEVCGQKQSGDTITIEVRHIEEQSRHTANLVKSMLLYTQKVPPEFAEVSANELLAAVVNDWRAAKLDPRVRLQLDLPQNPIGLVADRFQLQESLTHLLNHAQQALLAEPPSHDPRLLVMLGESGGLARLVIAHNGYGLTPRALERIFEPNFGAQHETGDTGLELHLCQHVIQAHGGTLACASEGRDGLRFIIGLPVHHKPQPQAGQVTIVDVPAISPLSGLRVLVVDDDPVISGLMREVLLADGVQVEAVTDPREGLRLATEKEFDLVLSDIRMPGLNGREFRDELRRIRPALASRVIFTTGDISAQEPGDVGGNGGTQFLLKPFSFDQLRQAMSTRLGEIKPAA